MRFWVIALLCAAAVGATARAQSAATRPPAVHELLGAYWRGEFDVVSRRFTTGQQVAALLPGARAWVATSEARAWEFGSVVLFLELADAAVRLPDPSPTAAMEFVRLGHVQLTDRRRKSAQRDIDPSTELQWHSAALAVMQGTGAWAEQEKYLKNLERRFPEGSPRLAMAAGIAIEQRFASAGEAGASGDAVRVANNLERALDDAVRQYDRAARDPALRPEASARAASIYVRLSRYRDAVRRLDLAGGSDEVLVESWLAHLRGLTLDGLEQPAGGEEFRQRARQLTGAVENPWRELERGDFRMVPAWLAGLKGVVATTTADPKITRMPSALVLDRYAGGSFDAVASALSETGSLAQFSKDFKAAARPWVEEATDANDLARRRLVAAAVALEAAQARGLVEWGEAQLLIEFVCDWWRELDPPTEAERMWYHATAALMEGMAAGVALELHVGHGLKRFPEDPDLVMARGVAAELRAGVDSRTTVGLRAPDSALLGAAEARLKTALAFASTRPEASLRLGSIALRRGRIEQALEYFAVASTAVEDGFVVHLAHLLSGRAFAQMDRWPDAVTSYRAAVGIVPTQTSRLALVAALSRIGEYREAAALAEAALDSADPGPDPWLWYGQADFRHWPKLIARVRGATVR